MNDYIYNWSNKTLNLFDQFKYTTTGLINGIPLKIFGVNNYESHFQQYDYNFHLPDFNIS